MMRLPSPLLIGLVCLGCGSSSVQTSQLPDGTWKVTCKTSYDKCLRKAESICPGARTVLGGGNRDEIYGYEGNQVATRKSEVYVRCDNSEQGSYRLKREVKPAASDPVPTDEAAERARSCTPGTTQRCVGPGACEGGQACLPDGSGFGPCDCGPASPAASPGTTNSPAADAGGAGSAGAPQK